MREMRKLFLLLTIPFLLFSGCAGKKDDAPRRLEILFLGHESEHHNSQQLAEILSREYFKEGINITYTTDPDDLTRDDLGIYDGLILYANHDSITKAQEQGLLHFVKSGKGFIPLHSASWCFRNSAEVVDLIGGQFKSHEGGSFSAEIVKPDHPAMNGVEAFTTEWDETYIHDKLSDKITVLMERVEGDHREPYTWVRDYGKGRVFYTAFGHDARTFNNPGFLQLVRSGILWAVGDEAKARLEQFALAEAVYEPGKMPNYEKRDPPPQYQHPLSPEESMSQIQVPAGFELELFAAEPDIINPIAMAWDERGRLWVIETEDYPNTVIDTPGLGDDRIKICEDTDGDGRADKFTVFADKLNIPTSLVFANGGLIVSQAPHFLFLKDTDGDDKADVREVLFDGWGTYDTHAGPSNLKYGMDNKVWGTVGYSGFEGNLGGKNMRFGSGLYRFSPDGKAFEFLAPTTNNTWGLGFSEEFDVFLSTANNEHSDHFAIPDRLYELAGLAEKGIEKIDGHYAMHVVTKNLRQVDVPGGFTAAAGHNLYTARAFPEEYWNRIAFVCEPTGRIIHRAVLEKNGSGFEEKDGWNFTASADEWFGPVHAEVGPDGALWVLDWYNFIIQHNPTPEGFENGKGNAYIDSLREYTRGRIYRISYENAPDYDPLELSGEEPKKLVRALRHDNMFWRLTAQRMLVETGNKEIAGDLYDLVSDRNVDKTGINAGAMHALWTLHGLGLLDGASREALDAALEALKHPAAGVRKAAVQVLPRNQHMRESLLASGLLNDPDMRVRVAVLLALAEMPPSAQAGKALYEAANLPENAKDKWISHALLIAAKVNREGFMEAYESKGAAAAGPGAEASLTDRIAAGDRMKVFPFNKWTTIRSRDLPDITGREIRITADITRSQEEEERRGVILAHGNAENGYALYMKEGQLNFQVNRNGSSEIIATSADLPGKFRLTASLTKDGAMSLFLDGKPAASGNAEGLLESQPENSLSVGYDRKEDGYVGDYGDDFNFGGYIENGQLVFLQAGAAAVSAEEADQVINLSTIVNEMKYDKTELTLKAGSTVKIVFTNPDHMQHNLLILEPGSLEKVGAAADKLALDPQGASRDYIPQMPEILFTTPLVDPRETYELVFKVPETPGEYPFVCTFPGHWRIMNGIITVE